MSHLKTKEMEDSTNNSQLLGESKGIEKHNNHSKQSPKLRKKKLNNK